MAAAGAGAGNGKNKLYETDEYRREDNVINDLEVFSNAESVNWPLQIEDCKKLIEKMISNLKHDKPITVSIESPYDLYNTKSPMTVSITLTVDAGDLGISENYYSGKRIRKTQETLQIKFPNIRSLYLSNKFEGKTIKEKLEHIYDTICLDVLAEIYKYILANNYHSSGHFKKLKGKIDTYIYKITKGNSAKIPGIIAEIREAFTEQFKTPEEQAYALIDNKPHPGGPDIFKNIGSQINFILTDEGAAAGGAEAGAAAGAGGAAAGAGGAGNNSNNNNMRGKGLGGGRRRKTKRRHHKKRKQTRRRR